MVWDQRQGCRPSDAGSNRIGAMTDHPRPVSRSEPVTPAHVLPLVYDELRRLARSHLRRERPDHTLGRTGLIHEAFLRLTQHGSESFESRSSFCAAMSRVMLHVLVDHARARNACKRGGKEVVQSLEALRDEGHEPASDAIVDTDACRLTEALARLERLDPRQCRVVEMRFLIGLSVEETAEALDISCATVKRDWVTAKAWLLLQLRGR